MPEHAAKLLDQVRGKIRLKHYNAIRRIHRVQ